ncbi:hypothetical protein ANANG_G00281170 [Anguilla anguilla]|uniref:Uncharacterized protein n=1 Tax=Anguilla anguilla TaxID=7936 RepID=A0A9D3LQV6_ANGAN|nr:hypothetical protein ANANG_G00281170 [Anguilla anguilla]
MKSSLRALSVCRKAVETLNGACFHTRGRAGAPRGCWSSPLWPSVVLRRCRCTAALWRRRSQTQGWSLTFTFRWPFTRLIAGVFTAAKPAGGRRRAFEWAGRHRVRYADGSLRPSAGAASLTGPVCGAGSPGR